MKRNVWLALCSAAAVLSPVGTMIVPPTIVHAAEPTLHVGAKGSAVVVLQQDLMAKGFFRGRADGDFGQYTLAAVKAFQLANHLTPDGIVGSGTWAALTGNSASGGSGSSTSPVYSLKQKTIFYNGTSVSTPMGFAYQGTTYMPIFYVNQMLTKLNVQTSWDGKSWTLTVPSNMKVDLTSLQPGTGGQSISLNGTVVERLDGIKYPDPYSHVTTDYMPIWYLMQALGRAGIQSKWDGTNWHISTVPPFAAYDKSGNKLGGFQTQADAQNALQNVPGGTVKNQAGQVVFTQSDFVAFTAPGTSGQDFTSETSATAAVYGSPIGYVVNELSGKVVQPPSVYYYEDSQGNWKSSVDGWLGTAVPPFAQPGAVYVGLDVNPGNSPHNTKLYLISLADGTYKGTLAGTFENPFRNVNLSFPAPGTVTAQQIDTWLQQQGSPMQGLGQAFIDAQNMYGVDATYLVAHAIIESDWGQSSISQAKNNLFGYGAYDADPTNDAGIFPTESYAIQFQAWEVLNNYLKSDGSHFYQWPTLDGMNEHYATDPSWSSSIASIMNEYVNQTGGSASSYTQYTPGQTPPTLPSASTEPVFHMNGATATVLKNPYTALPVYADPGTGSNDMFGGSLQVGSSGSAVKQLQEALNSTQNAGLVADGQYGPLTANAVKVFQGTHNLPVTGVCDLATWNSLFPAAAIPAVSIPVGTTITVDQMIQEMTGGKVTEWYHVTSGTTTGWVDSQFVAFSNVYRVHPLTGYNVSVYSQENLTSPFLTSLHVGDYVVVPNTVADATGFIPVLLVINGQPVTGYLSATSVGLVPITPPNVPF